MAAVLVFALGIVACLFYVLLVEPNTVRLTRLELHFPQLPSAFDGLHIIHITDLHLIRPGARERKAAAIINRLQPDLVLCTGDLFDDGSLSKEIVDWLNCLNPGGDTYFVLGNHDVAYPIARPVVQKVLEMMGLKVLRNEALFLTRGNDRIRLIGVDDPFCGADDLDICLTQKQEPIFTVLLAHSPDIHDDILRHPVNLTLAGHTHGGQVCLPGFGPLYTNTRRTPRRRCAGLTWFDDSRAMYVSRGLGMSSLPIRFLSFPEVVSLVLRCSSPGSCFSSRSPSRDENSFSPGADVVASGVKML